MMRVFNGFDHLPRFRKPVVTVGSYDGVHAGHRKLLEKINRIAAGNGGESVVVTFSPHPREVLPGGDGVKLLSSPREKAILLERAGIDNLIVVPFTPEFSMLSSYDFVKRHLIDKIGVDTLVVGYNHHFGHDKRGDFNYLERMGGEFGFGIYMVPRYDVDDDKVSSTVVRELIAAGKVTEAEKYLGYPYFIMGHMAAGGIFEPGSRSKLLPPQGDYPVELYVGNFIASPVENFAGDDYDTPTDNFADKAGGRSGKDGQTGQTGRLLRHASQRRGMLSVGEDGTLRLRPESNMASDSESSHTSAPEPLPVSGSEVTVTFIRG